jgi:hypothetical protein
VGFFVTARWLGHRREWATAGALLFAFCYHNVTRGFAHLSLILTYTVPLVLLSCWLVARSQRLGLTSKGTLLCCITAMAVGIGDPYNLFLFLQLMSWAIVARWLSGRNARNCRIGVMAMAIAGGIFFLVNADVWLAASGEGAVPLIARNYGGVEQYALKPIELLLPPADHRIGGFAFWGQRYLRWSDWRGESFSPYLGAFGVIGFSGLIAAFCVAVLRGQAARVGLGLQAAWILIFSVIGGVNSVLALFFGLQMFRGTNRYSIFILALALVFLVAAASRFARRYSRLTSVAVATLVTLVGLWEEIPLSRGLMQVTTSNQRFLSDRNFGAAMERLLPAGAMVFQLPFLEFPEARPINRLEDYELFRPFLHTSTLRFTYGALKHRARSQWYREYAHLPLADLVTRLEANGFSAIYVNRLGYADNGDAIVAALNRLGKGTMLQSAARQQLLIKLNPRPRPIPPLASQFTFGNGWNTQNDVGGVRWAYGDASISYFNPFPYPIWASATFVLRADDSRRISVNLNGNEIIQSPVDPNPSTLHLAHFALQPGSNRLDLRTAQAPVRVSEKRSSLHAFGLGSAILQLERESILVAAGNDKMN